MNYYSTQKFIKNKFFFKVKSKSFFFEKNVNYLNFFLNSVNVFMDFKKEGSSLFSMFIYPTTLVKKWQEKATNMVRRKAVMKEKLRLRRIKRKRLALLKSGVNLKKIKMLFSNNKNQRQSKTFKDIEVFKKDKKGNNINFVGKFK